MIEFAGDMYNLVLFNELPYEIREDLKNKPKNYLDHINKLNILVYYLNPKMQSYNKMILFNYAEALIKDYESKFKNNTDILKIKKECMKLKRCYLGF